MHPAMMIVTLLALLALTLTAEAQRQPETPDQVYCGRLSELYLRYIGPNPNTSSLAGVTPNVEGGVAVAQCREGNAAASIPVLERLLTRSGFTLPPRG